MLYFDINTDTLSNHSLPKSLTDSTCLAIIETVSILSAMTPAEETHDNDLSNRRANYVKQELEKNGILESQITIKDLKTSQPKLVNFPEDELNRNVTIQLSWP